MANANDLSQSVIFPKGQKVANDHFIGAAWVQTLVPAGDIFNCSVANVPFELCARNNWHEHPGGQILLVTAGKGYFQEEGQQARLIQEGDVVRIDPNTKHWHGATPESWLVHLALITNPQKGDAQWFEPVADNDYKKLK